ncbi:MAG: hypothetical protein A2287_05935 [Candidatus Melainabacteria bacterium RIFOXYA12_FULL_32_12]|nr:MAG: hypothetical protein A2255_03040 [Candidatus Melainabacteria bacterium RIFOXYA2_FULL_32_9]OGI30889.1 MAG: hypothetical protein A2287_05935 [Candidatus Melainabacteria bacterium RIFOXYA12_FULL_32_12]
MIFKLSNRLKYALIILLLLHNQAFSSQIDFNAINSIELQLFNQSFINEPISARLDRIEQSAFGKTYNDDIARRVFRVSQIVNKYSRNQNIGNVLDSDELISADNSATDYPAVTQLEIKVFHEAFVRENIYSRLNRLESKVFGTTFSSQSLADRLDRLKSAIDPNADDLAYDEKTSTIYSTHNGSTIYTNVSVLEQKVFGQSFDNELVSLRLERLEKKIFGAIQSGMFDTRISRLNNAVENTSGQSGNLPGQPNQNYLGNNGMQDNSFFSNGMGEWEEDFFCDQPQNQSTLSSSGGLLNLLQMLAVPFIAGYLNRNNSNTVDPNYYQYQNNGYPYNANYPYAYPTNNHYGVPSGYWGNNYGYNNFGAYPQTHIITRQLLHNGMGAGVHILP